MEICILDFKKKNKWLKKSSITLQDIEIKEISCIVKKLTVISRTKIPAKITRELEENLEKFSDVISEKEIFEKYDRKGSNCTVMTLTPTICLRKCASISGTDIEKDCIAIELKKNTQQNIEIILKLCEIMNFVTVYHNDNPGLSELIMEKTGLCISEKPLGKIEEKFIVRLSDNTTFEDREKNRVYSDLEIENPIRIPKYSNLPSDRIFYAWLREINAEKYIKSNNVKIKGIK